MSGSSDAAIDAALGYGPPARSPKVKGTKSLTPTQAIDALFLTPPPPPGPTPPQEPGYLTKLSKAVTEGVPAAGKAFMKAQEGPTLASSLREEAQRPDTKTNPLSKALYGPYGAPGYVLDLGERGLRLFQGAIDAASEFSGDPVPGKPLTKAVIGNIPFLGRAPYSPVMDAARKRLMRPQIPDPVVSPQAALAERLRRAQGAMRAGETPYVASNVVQGPAPAYGPPAPPQPPRPRPSNIDPVPILPSGPAKVDPLQLPKRVERPVPPLQTAEEIAAKRAGIDTSLPAEKPTAILDATGKPIMVTRPGWKPSQGVPEPTPLPAELPPPAPPATTPKQGIGATAVQRIKDRRAANRAETKPAPTAVTPRPVVAPVETSVTPVAPSPPKGLVVVLGDQRYPVASLEDASKRFGATVEAAGTGASKTPPVLVERDGQVLGHISYNGRIWPGRPEAWTSDLAPLYDSRLPAVKPSPSPPAAPALKPAAPLAWNPITPPRGGLEAFQSKGGRFVVEQSTPDAWRVRDTVKGGETVVPTFHEARQWAAAQAAPKVTPQVPKAPTAAPRLAPATEEGLLTEIRLGTPPADVGVTLKDWQDMGPGDRKGVIEFFRTVMGGDESGAINPAAIWGRMKTVRDAFREAAQALGPKTVGYANKAFRPTIGRFEQLGDAGRDISRRILGTEKDRRQMYGTYAEPVAQRLDRLSSVERENLRQLLEGETTRPMSQAVADAAGAFRRVMGDTTSWLVQNAMKRGITVLDRAGLARPFAPRSNFMPHEYTEAFRKEVIQPNSPLRERSIQHLLETKQALDPEQAAAMLDQRFGHRMVEFGGQRYILDPERYVGGLERAREINLPGYITDPAEAFRIRMHKVTRRFAELDNYGQMDQIIGTPGGVLAFDTLQPMPAGGLIGRIQQTHGPEAAQNAYRMFHQQVGSAREGSEALRNTAARITTLEAMKDLPLATIANVSQPFVQGPLRTSISTMAKAMGKAITAEGRAAARDLGVFNDQVLRDVMAEASGHVPQGRLAGAILKPFQVAERINQIIGINAGRVWTTKLERAMAAPSPRTQAWLRRELDRLYFRPEEQAAILARKGFTEAEKNAVAWHINDQMNFVARRARRSEWANTPEGSVLFMYKSFAASSGRLLKQAVIDEARRGNFAPAARLALLAPLVGEAVQDVRSLVRGTERPDGAGHRILDNLTAVGGLGIAASYVESMLRAGRGGMVDFAVGPAITTAAKMTEAVGRWVKAAGGAAIADAEGRGGDWSRVTERGRTLRREVVKMTPYVGPYAASQMRTDPKGREIQGQTWQQRLRLDPEDRARRQRKHEDRTRANERRSERDDVRDRLRAAGYLP